MSAAIFASRRAAFALPTLAISWASIAGAEEAPALKIFRELERTWNNHDPEGNAGLYWPDGELVNIFGVVYAGPAAIAARTAEMFAGGMKGAQVVSTVRKITPLGRDSILLDTDQQNTGILKPDGAREPVQTRFKHVLLRRSGVWKIIASQNTRVIQQTF